MLRGASIEDEALRQCSGRDVPAITADGLENSVTIQLPLYHVRRKLTARDPRAVVAAYRYEVKFKLPMLLGLRVCPDCPNCNIYVDGYVLRSPCQDIFGLNTLPMGGLAGLAGTMGGATEFQKCNTPHEHAHVHLVNIYQHRTLAEIAEAIEKAWLDPQTILRFNEWIHVEDTILPSQYAADRDTVALAWHKRYDDGKHEGICSIPSSVTRALDIPVEESTSESWCRRYDRDAQYMFSRVQEHVHQKTKNGYIPLRACLSARCKTKCKHGFPKKIMVRCTVVCNGNYRHLKVRISGRRNALGLLFNQRSEQYQSGTMKGFAVATGSNTHTAPNYRLPVNAKTHDPLCYNEHCLAAIAKEAQAVGRSDIYRLCKITHRASREMSGYYMGYTFKGQPVGKKAIKLVDKSFEYLVRSLDDLPEEKRFRRTAIRSMVAFHHSTTSRPATEETLLSMYLSDDDVTSAEFIRLYVNKDFYGSCLLRALEREQEQRGSKQCKKRIGQKKYSADIR